MKIVQNPLFRSCAARFGEIAFLSVKVFQFVTLAWNSRQNGKTVTFPWKFYTTLFSGHAEHVLAKSHFSVKVLKIVKLASNSLQNGKTVRFPWKYYKTLFSGHAQHVLAKSHFWTSKFPNSSHWPEILAKSGKKCGFHENCTQRSFQVIRSTFCPNRIFERQSFQRRHTSLKVSSNRENGAFTMKIVQNALFRSCAARCGPIAFVSVKTLKIVTLDSNSRQKVKGVSFPWKFYKTLVSGHAQTVLAKSYFWASKFSNSSHWPEILAKTGKQCAFHENGTKRFLQVMRSTFSSNRVLERQSSQNRHTGLKFSPKREKSALFYENCTKRSFQVMRSTFWPNRICER